MGYPDYFGTDEERMSVLREKFAPVEEGRFWYCIQEKKMDIEGVNKFQADLKISLGFTIKEYERMKELRKVYNEDYENDHKSYFSTITDVMGKMRSTLAAHKNTLNRLRPRKAKKATLAYDPTALHDGTYSEDLFGWEAYEGNTVKQLYDTLNGYLGLAKKVYDEATAIIEEEKAIRADPEQACPRFDRSFSRSKRNNGKLIEMMENSNVDPDHELVKAMEAAEDVRQLIARLFHEMSVPEFNHFCACKVIHDSRKANITAEEMRIFGNEEKVMKLRTLTDHILELTKQRDDAIGWEGMLGGEFVMHLLYWCGWDGTKNPAMLNYITRRCEGKIKVVKIGAVMAAKQKLFPKSNEEIASEQEEFNQCMDAFVQAVATKTEPEVA